MEKQNDPARFMDLYNGRCYDGSSSSNTFLGTSGGDTVMSKILMAEINETKEGYLKRSDMTLRDYFAGQAIIPFMNWSLEQSKENGYTAVTAAKRYAKSAYLIADAMLEARK